MLRDEAFIEDVRKSIQVDGIELLDLFIMRTKHGKKIDAVIFKRDAVSHDDCSHVTMRIKQMLRQSGEDPDAFSLSVSSPGFARKLKDEREYQLFVGAPVRLHLNDDGRIHYEQQTIEGENFGVDDTVLIIRTESGDAKQIDMRYIRYVKLNY